MLQNVPPPIGSAVTVVTRVNSVARATLKRKEQIDAAIKDIPPAVQPPSTTG
jgi:hypothetical protein